MESIRQRAKDGLLALCVEVGLNTLEMMFEQELEEKIGKKGKHNADRSSYRHSYEPRKVVLGGRKVQVSKPRDRTVDGKEVVLESYEAVKNDEILTRHAFETMLYGLSTRNYAFGLEDVNDVKQTITIGRLVLTAALRRTIRSTNPIESAIEMARTTACRVKKWRNGNQVLRWTVAVLQEAERRF
ncbi:MAG: transposase [Firmicutes bacterium]|nr:transposase [Bacillota bacterium]